MKEKDIKLNFVSANSFVRAYKHGDDMDKIIQAFELVCNEFTPNPGTYNSLFYFLGFHKQFGLMEQYYKQLTERHLDLLRKSHFDTIIQRLTHFKDIKALSYFEKMISNVSLMRIDPLIVYCHG